MTEIYIRLLDRLPVLAALPLLARCGTNKGAEYSICATPVLIGNYTVVVCSVIKYMYEDVVVIMLTSILVGKIEEKQCYNENPVLENVETENEIETWMQHVPRKCACKVDAYEGRMVTTKRIYHFINNQRSFWAIKG